MKKKRLIQILGDMWEELWLFPHHVTDEQIKEAFDEYRDSEYETFEEYLEESESELEGERIFVDTEIIVD